MQFAKQTTADNEYQVMRALMANEMADQLARLGSEHPFIGPEPTCCISTAVPKKVVKDWTKRYNRKPRLLEQPSLTTILQGVYFIFYIFCH
jgi:hypothetical protein